MITIQELLFNRGLDRNAKIKLIRHKDSRQDVYNLYRYNKDQFLDYQRSQTKNIFEGVDFIVSFIGERGKFARFIGVYKIISKTKSTDGLNWYEMKELDGFGDLKERVIIH